MSCTDDTLLWSTWSLPGDLCLLLFSEVAERRLPMGVDFLEEIFRSIKMSIGSPLRLPGVCSLAEDWPVMRAS